MGLRPKYRARSCTMALGYLSRLARGWISRLLCPAEEGTVPAGMERALRGKALAELLQQIPRSHLLLLGHGSSACGPQLLTGYQSDTWRSIDQAVAAKTVKPIKWGYSPAGHIQDAFHLLPELRIGGESDCPEEGGGGSIIIANRAIEAVVGVGSIELAAGS